MLDHARPTTGLLAAFCLWALALLVLAVAGFGGRAPPLPDDRTLVTALPKARLVPVATRLGAATDYAEVGSRPLLTYDRRPAPVTPVAGEGSNDLDVVLTSVLITPRLQLAILTENQTGASRRVRAGDQVPGTAWRVLQVEPRRAVLEGPSGQRVLELRVYTGGAPGAVDVAARTEVAPAMPPPAPGGEPQGGAPEVPPPLPTPPTAETLTQEQQIEAIRKRIEARRAQMRAEAGKAAEDKR